MHLVPFYGKKNVYTLHLWSRLTNPFQFPHHNMDSYAPATRYAGPRYDVNNAQVYTQLLLWYKSNQSAQFVKQELG